MSLKNFNYGLPPEYLGKFEIPELENCYYLYLPIKMPRDNNYRIPQPLWPLRDLVEAVDRDYVCRDNHYVYLTVKNMIIEKGYSLNRSGWHSDGFGTNDLNFIWYDTHPTHFLTKKLTNVPEDDEKALEYFSELGDCWDSFIKFPPKTLIGMDQYVIHRVNPSPFKGQRCFVKISVSKDKYNLKGNSHNYLFDYSWDMKERKQTRNHPIASDT